MDVNKSITVVIAIISLLVLFGWLYSHFQAHKKFNLKHFIVLFLYALLFSQVIGWAMKETDSFETAIKILKEDEIIRHYIGKYKGHSFDQKDLPTSEANPAEIKVTLNGTKGSVFIHCRMQLNKEWQWELKEIIRKEEK